MFFKNTFIRVLFIIFLSIRVRLSWNNGDNRNVFRKPKSKLGLYHVVHTTPKISPGKLTITVVEMQKLPEIEKTDSKEELSCLKWTIKKGSKKVCLRFQTNTEKLNVVLYRYRNSFYLEEKVVAVKLTEYQSLLSKQVYPLSYIDILYKRCMVLDETSIHN